MLFCFGVVLFCCVVALGSDESTLEILADNCRHVRRRPGEEFLPQCLVEKVKHPLKIMLWGAISVKVPGRLYVVQGTMNAEQYKTVVKNRLMLQLSDWFPDGNCVFMHDSEPCHTAKVIKQFDDEVGLKRCYHVRAIART